ncbi:TetR/AcrR family transcriptional regulator [Paenibacillus kobensis]|uniref:TetR/AcrR family transcriptional regulator n=1 Tax=Paenibacillus kobensis TaxID=59841 RepID=UPI000FDBA984|nr:TetR/AcrR family transcriptional regulator [Paenibacillus kobensis]
MGRTNVPAARERILQAAVKLFANKSFEGSRIDEIAKEANVPKSLIYYHFSSKDEMLEVLMNDFVDQFTGLLRTGPDTGGHDDALALQGRINHYYGFALRNADLIRVLFMESLKKNADKPVMYRVVETLVDAERDMNGLEGADGDRNERLVGEFFNGVLPLFGYICFADSWTRSFNIERETFDTLFKQSFSAAHSGYHLARGGQNEQT